MKERLFFEPQELANILEYLESQRAGGNHSPQDAPDQAEGPGDASDGEGEEGGDEVAMTSTKAPLLQTFVFSATLTLPQGLRKRLRKGARPVVILALTCLSAKHLIFGFTEAASRAVLCAVCVERVLRMHRDGQQKLTCIAHEACPGDLLHASFASKEIVA